MLLDAMNHADVRPFWPVSDDNPFLDLMGNGELYLACLGAGFLAFALKRIRR